jgi:GAF domain-containing protein
MVGTPNADLAKALGDLAVEMQSKVDTEATLQSIVEGAVALVPGTRWAGVSLIQGRAVEARVPSDPLVAKLDALQSELNEGPSLSALREYRTVLIDDMSLESRWPTFSQRATELGVRSLLSFQLYTHQRNLGALNVYGDDVGVFSDESIFVGELLAQHASVALFGSEAEEQFDDALSTRDVIGQAKGIIMERFNVDAFAAFELLRRLSQESNTKLMDVARKVVRTRGGGN